MCVQLNNIGFLCTLARTCLRQTRQTLLPKPLLFLFIYSITQQVVGQSVFKKYTVYDGLVSNSVSDIEQDNSGFLWVGSYDGLSRYDGYKFTNFSKSNGNLSSDYILGVYPLADRLLVIEPHGNIETMENGKVVSKITIPAYATDIVNFNDRLLVGTYGNGFYENCNDTTAEFIKPIKYPLGKLTNINDSLLFSSSLYNSSFVMNQNLEVLCTYDNGVDGVWFFYKDSKHRLWVGTQNGMELVKLSKNNNGYHFEKLPLPPAFQIEPLQTVKIQTMLETPDGSFWFGGSPGVVRVLPDGSNKIYTRKDGLNASNVDILFFDKEENIWIGNGDGLLKWNEYINVAKNINVPPTYHHQYINVLPSGNIIFSTEDNILRYSPGSKAIDEIDIPDYKNVINIKRKTPKNGIPSRVFHWPGQYIPIRRSSPPLYLYPPFILQYNEDDNKLVYRQKQAYDIPGILHDALQHPTGLIFAGEDDLYVINPDIPGKADKILPHRINALMVDRNEYLWVGTYNNHLYQIKIDLKQKEDKRFQITDRSELVKHAHVTHLYLDSRDQIWASTRRNGLYCLKKDTDDSFSVRNYDTKSGLQTNWTMCVKENSQGNLWVGHRSGLDLLIRKDAIYRVFNYGKVANLDNLVQDIQSVDDKTWYIETFYGGFQSFKSDELHENNPPPTHILSATFGSGEDEISTLANTSTLKLKHDQNLARFEFSAPTYINEEQIEYSYRLGIGKENAKWSEPRNVHEALYHRLSPGQYQFEVRSIGWNGKAGKATVYSFSIKPPVHQRWWFIALCILLLAGILYAMYTYCVRELLRREQIRNRIASDLHDDLGSSLSSIHLLSEMAAGEDKASMQKYLLNRVSHYSRETMDKISDIVWTVKSTKNDGLALQERMRQFLFEICGAADIRHSFSEEGLDKLKLSLEQKKGLYLIFKEAINNAVKYSGASCITVAIQHQKKKISLSIEDDGIGFKPEPCIGGNGLTNMQNRAKELGGGIEIISSSGNGTKILCSIPVL